MTFTGTEIQTNIGTSDFPQPACVLQLPPDGKDVLMLFTIGLPSLASSGKSAKSLGAPLSRGHKATIFWHFS